MVTEQNNGLADERRSISAQTVSDDEIDLIDYVLVLVRHWRLILLGSLIPALVAGLVLFSLPRQYVVSYTYRMEVGESDLKILEDKFYSAENITRLIEEFQGHGLDKRARILAAAQTGKTLKEFVAFEVLPPLFDTKPKTFGEFRERIDAKGSLLVMQIRNSHPETLREAAQVIRRNFEQVIPLYFEKDELAGTLIELKSDMAEIEESRYSLNLELQRKKSTLDKLSHSAIETAGKAAGDVVLQFDIGRGDSAYLPLPYQIQAVRTQIINLEEGIRTNAEKYAYYADLLAMNETLLNHLNRGAQQRFTLEQFHLFLADMLTQYTSGTPHVKDHLSAYLKRLENAMAAAVPVTETPIVYAGEKGTLKKIAIVFAVAFLLSLFGAFLSEGLQRKKYQPVQLN